MTYSTWWPRSTTCECAVGSIPVDQPTLPVNCTWLQARTGRRVNAWFPGSAMHTTSKSSGISTSVTHGRPQGIVVGDLRSDALAAVLR